MDKAISESDYLYARLNTYRRLVDSAKRRIATALERCNSWSVSYSGGKDSTVTLDLVRQQAPGMLAIFVDSGAEFPETLEIISATPCVIHTHAQITLLEMYRMVGDYGSAGDVDMHWGVHDIVDSLIRNPMADTMEEHGALGAFTGLRAEESNARARFGSTHRQPWRTAVGGWRCEPVIDWPQEAIWAYIASRGLRYNAVYDRYAQMGVPHEQWRVAPFAGSTSIAYGRWAILKRGWPGLWNRFAEKFPRIRGYA